MKTIGKRTPPPLGADNGQGISQTSEFTRTLLSLSGGRILAPKGVFRYKSHEEANAHQAEWIAKTMAAVEADRVEAERAKAESDS